MLEYDSLLIAFISGLIGCFRFKLSDLTCPITNICNRTGQIGQLTTNESQILRATNNNSLNSISEHKVA